MSFENFIVRRYLFSRKKYQFITLIAWLSIIGIMIGVSALIIVMSIFNGFRGMQKDHLIGLDPHIKIYSSASEIIDFLEKDADVTEISYYKETKSLIAKGDKSTAAYILSYSNQDFIEEFRKRTSSNLYENGFLIGANFALANNLVTGDTIEILEPKQIKNSVLSYRNPIPKRNFISGVFYSNSKSYDDLYLINNSNQNENYEQIIAKVIEPDNIENLAKKLQSQFSNVKIETWKDKNSLLLGIMEFERYSTFIILSIIVIIAAFNLLVSISMTILEKEKDIAILRVIGASKESINKIFFRIGFFAGSFASVFGLLVGLLVIYTQQEYGWLPSGTAGGVMLPDIPIKGDLFEIGLAITVALLLSAISSYLPGRYIIKREIISSIAGDN
jgi:ABC-type lipoprotein release transport system permease subunit